MIEKTRDSKAIIFDCDGTLADTMPTHYQAWDDTLALYGVSLSRAELSQNMGRTTVELVRELSAARGWDVDAQTFAIQKEKRFKTLLGTVKAIEPVAEIARKLAGQFPMAVVSGGTAENVLFTLEAIGLKRLFEVIITADDPVKPKPSPDIFLEAARRLGVPPKDCIVFEDAEPGLIGALAAGMKIVDVREYLM